MLGRNRLKLGINDTKNVITRTVQVDIFFVSRRILKRRDTSRYSSTGTIAVRRYKNGIRRRKRPQKITFTLTRISGFPLFADAARHRGQCINKKFTKLSFVRIRQTPRFLFRFLKINFRGGTSYHDPYRDMKTNANKPSANGESSVKSDRNNRPAIAPTVRTTRSPNDQSDRV